MAFKDLRDFIAFLESRGQLQRIGVPVSCELEMTEIVDRLNKGKGRNVALLFENVPGYNLPVLMNLFSSQPRMAWALGVESLNDLTQRMASLVSTEIPASLIDKFRKLGELSELARFTPRLVRRAPCQEVVEIDNPSLSSLPILRCWPQDGGRFITLPLVITKNPLSGQRNVGMYRLQMYDERTLGLHWQIHKGGATHYRNAEALGQRMEVAIALGGDPATIFSGAAPLPPDVDEFIFAGWLRHAKVDLVKGVTVDLEVPAQAEIVLEGYVNPGEMRLEGPFGDHTGYYSLADYYPVFHLTAITHRRNPIYPASVEGPPPMEDYYIGKASERLFLPLIRMVLPEIVDMNLPPEGVFTHLGIVSIKKSFPGQPQKVMHGLWGLGLLSIVKTIVIVDEDVNVHNLSEVIWRLSCNIDPRRDISIVAGPIDALDHASPTPFYGSKMGIDATRKSAADGHPRPWPADIVMSEDIKRLVDSEWESLGL